MYELYTKECESKGLKAVEEHKYRYIFYTELNLDFLPPKKDQCITCETLKQLDKKDQLNGHLHMTDCTRWQKKLTKARLSKVQACKCKHACYYL